MIDEYKALKYDIMVKGMKTKVFNKLLYVAIVVDILKLITCEI